MKLLRPLIYMYVATALQPAFAQEDFNAYRLGNYQLAADTLINNIDKKGVADYYLGRLYLYGYGQLKNNNLALRHLAVSANKGYLPAQHLMARYALLKENNPQESFRLFKKAAESGDIEANMYVAAAYLFGIGVGKNEDKARQYYIEAAKKGNTVAQYSLAKNFLNSRQSTNKKLGLIWLNKAVKSGNPRALTEMAKFSLAGKIVPKDPELAQSLLNKAVAQNYTPAMMQLGKIALDNKDYNAALSWFQKAAQLGYKPAALAQADLYLLELTPFHNKESGFLTLLKLAQAGYIPAEIKLSEMYAKGIGVPADKHIADQWLAKAKAKPASQDNALQLAKAARWLSNGATEKMTDTNYQIGGILSAWTNNNALRENNYNPAPQRSILTLQMLFKPAFNLTQPNEIALSTYYDALVNNSVDINKENWHFPIYALNPAIENMQSAYSFVLRRHDQKLPYADSYPLLNTEESIDLLNFDNINIEKHLNYLALVEQLEQRAILGDGEAQFDLGQLYQYGIAVPKNEEHAIILYQNAIDQQHEGAEYSLGILYLNRANPADMQLGEDLLLSVAFKGNKYAQYALANLLPQSSKEQAIAMQYLAAANGYGLAQYALAEYLVREKSGDLSVPAQEEKIKRIRSLYASAVKQGIVEALVPLAFYNAMETDKLQQAQAFKVALEQAQAGNSKAALLTGLLYDRGIGVSQDRTKALSWYQQAGRSSVRDFIVATYISEGLTANNRERGKTMLKDAAEAKFSYANLNLAVLSYKNGQTFLPELITAYQLGNTKAGILLADYYVSANNNAKMQEAKSIYLGLAEKGDQNAQLKLAYMFAEGLGNKPDWQQAQRWYTAAAEQGNPDAQYLLAELYQRGELGEPDYAQAIAWYQKAAKQLPKASVALGFIYETVFDDYPNAFKAYEAAANQDDILGIYNLALMFQQGKGMQVDNVKASMLFEKVATRGYSPAMNQLAEAYFRGIGRVKDNNQTLYWYKKAADLGNANAAYELGLLSETGIATDISPNNTVRYYQIAADKGNEKALLALARIYNYGIGVPKNSDLALKYYETLAKKNNAYAQLQLAKQYLTQNDKKGRKLLEDASLNGNVQATIMLQRLQAQSQEKISYVEPISINTLSLTVQPADQMYFNALNAWNLGDETTSRLMLKQLMHNYPHYTPAQKALEKLNA